MQGPTIILRDVEVAGGGEDEQEGRTEGRNRQDWRYKFYIHPNQTTGDIVCKVRNVRSEHTSNIASKNESSMKMRYRRAADFSIGAFDSTVNA